MKEKIKVVFEDWYYECGDGCCSDYGTRVYVNGEPLRSKEVDDSNYIGLESINVVPALLEKLGYDVEVEYTGTDN